MLTCEQRLGAGRSGEVFLVKKDGQQLARKVFGGDRLARLVHYIFTGAPNAYVWNEDAMQSALYRRKILAALVETWFDGQLTVAQAIDYSWNEQAKAWQLDTQFIDGRPLPLCHPLSDDDGHLKNIRHQVMQPLQRLLRTSGFDGLVWQAGKGNPVALNNFLLVDGADGQVSYCFIDLESGVPALFPLDPTALLTFYLPTSLRYGRPLFDDVHPEKLRRYLEDQRPLIIARLGEEGYQQLGKWLERLAEHQRRWKGKPRVERGIEYQLCKGRLSIERADWYRRHPWRWRLREIGRATAKAAELLLLRLPRKLARTLLAIKIRPLLERSWKLIRSQQYRAEFARSIVRERIEHWSERGQLDDHQRQRMLEDLEADAASPYLTDFGVHVGLKVTVQIVELMLYSALFATGIISGPVLALLIAADGAIYRSAYTLYRMLHAARRMKPLPWVALLVGLLPLVGSLAFPAQMIWSAVGREDRVARFIVYDTFTAIGAKLPIWGGRDTLTEHYFNRLAHRLTGVPRNAT
jgi:hypothetical protein